MWIHLCELEIIIWIHLCELENIMWIHLCELENIMWNTITIDEKYNNCRQYSHNCENDHMND